MTEDGRVCVCRDVAVLSMWGHGWVGASLMDRLDKALPSETPWQELYEREREPAQRASVGTITDRTELERKLQSGYWLTNWDEKGCALFNPPLMNGLARYVSKKLADEYRWMRGVK